jgi:signal transduction histidine kinase/CheY-like chemotaxis protein
MKAVGKVLPVIAGLLILLTYLLVRGATPDAALHERTLESLRTLLLDDAALQRDLLRARAGLLRNYDPLVESVGGLRRAVDALSGLRQSDGTGDAALGGQVDELAAAIGRQEGLVESFKSSNALLRNSLNYFDHSIHEISQRPSDAATAAVLGALANSMLRFAGDPSPDAARAVSASLADLDPLPATADSQPDMRALVAHGRMIVATLPAVDGLLRQLLAAPIAERTRLLQDRYLEAHGQATARAAVYRLLLYAASVLLVGYLGYLFLRLRANARSLAARLRFERLVAAISTEFINLAPDALHAGIARGLGRLAQHAGFDRASILFCAADGSSVERAYRWPDEGDPASQSGHDMDLLSLGMRWGLPAYERQGCIHVPSVMLMPPSPERTALKGRATRSWLCVPLSRGGQAVGMLALETVQEQAARPADDLALFRTAGEIFVNALARERAEGEREALAARLRQAQRLEAIGTLAGGIAHNFNNVLGAILGYSEMALGGLASDSRPWRQVREVRLAGERAKAIVDQILTFGRRGERKRGPLPMRMLVEEAIGLLRASLPPTVVIRAQFMGGDAIVEGDPAQLQQVVMNLCTNAAQAMDGRGVVAVAVEPVELAGRRILSHGRLAPGRYVRLSVSDTGSGMDGATMERLFEPFFTTKPPGIGTGLGLASVHGIVSDHGGALDVRSQPGRGSTFEAYLAASGAVAPAEEQSAAPALAGRGETILLVDDDKALMLLGEEMLAALGYEPVGFESAGKALAAFRADPHRFDLMLADEVMPDMTGSELAAAVHAIRPDMPIMVVTGYGAPVSWDRLRAAGVRELLKKPLASADLAAALARHLRRAEPARPQSVTPGPISRAG